MVDHGRRSFFRKFAAATAGAMALGVAAKADGVISLMDPERELWVPGAKTFIDLHTPTILRPDADREVFERTLESKVASQYVARHDEPGVPFVGIDKGKLYDPSRYIVTTNDHVALTYDSDWQFQHAIDLSNRSKALTVAEQRDLAWRVFEQRGFVGGPAGIRRG